MEPENDRILFNTVQPFVRLANKDPGILEECQMMMNQAIKINPENSNYYTELGYISLLKNDIKQSQEYYTKATTLDPENINALEGICY
jgi:tetratricopeptide repeat protein 21B